ncbi:hypothetical protein [Naasia aerilata]|uniref:hypothetical protein n=1 Tax=Naasia aerilata TaxID=1162966 RepID=UPI0025728205|nr:hypothetical protein [Naasia aerilata]
MLDLLIEARVAHPELVVAEEAVNGQVGLALRSRGLVVAVVGMRTEGARVTDLWVVLNPDKLGGWREPLTGPLDFEREKGGR